MNHHDPLHIKHLHSLGFAEDRDALKLQDNPFGGSAARQGRPMSDPLSNAGAFLHAVSQPGTILDGIIVDTCSLANAYKVQLSDGRPPKVGFLLSKTSPSVSGAKDIATLSPGTAVTCVLSRNLRDLIILGAHPASVTKASLTMSTVLHGATRQRVDRSHRVPLEIAPEDTLKSYTGYRLYDSAGGGEAGWMTETGLRIFIDPFMVMLGVNEASNLTFFLYDKLVRMAAAQWQLWTGSSETEAFNDQGELSHWTGYSQYWWEHAGLPAAAALFRENTAEAWQTSQPHQGKTEPIDPMLRPFHREVEWHGYLGQGHKRSLYGKPSAQSKFGTPPPSKDCRGLADHFTTLDGVMAWQSVRGFSMMKMPLIALPARLQKPEARTGDTEASYKFNGLNGTEAAYSLPGDLSAVGDINKQANSRAAASTDQQAYLFNLKGLHTFLHHSKDYFMPELSSLEGAMVVPAFSALQSNQQMDPEQMRQDIEIDHRYGTVPVYGSVAGWHLQPDGSYSILGGSGESIQMVQGEIHISAPGGIWIKSGKTLALLGGDDLVLKGRNSVDITATNTDVRIKAQKNLDMVGGVDPAGGVLLESKSFGSAYSAQPGEDVVHTGLTVKSAGGSLVLMGSDVYTRATQGSVTLDAAKGGGNIVTNSSGIVNFASAGEKWYFSLGSDTVSPPAAVLDQSQLLIPGDLFVQGQTFLVGAVSTGTTVSTGGTVYMPQFEQSSGEIGQQVTEQVREKQNSEVTNGQSQYDNLLKQSAYEDGLKGADDIISDLGFSFRTDSQYNSANVTFVFEDRWQQLARLTNQQLPTWQENPITVQGEETYPFPGKLAYTTPTVLQKQDLTLFDPETQQIRNRKNADGEIVDQYKDAKLQAPFGATFHEFIVVAQ